MVGEGVSARLLAGAGAVLRREGLVRALDLCAATIEHPHDSEARCLLVVAKARLHVTPPERFATVLVSDLAGCKTLAQLAKSGKRQPHTEHARSIVIA